MLVFWTWFFYQMINEGHTLMGEDVFPDPSTFTDAELGIE
ncbi:hypothetical protein PHET_10524 [Paragonimus heterotremus]|uniref:Uncharacterized protein n=1 Tax=Paragonimus heterotremus TaxID=100268 RepID=A0A8J4T6F9_9TREM|nr:hypothetical protein PHET_10524 [Paragonimus heterotremus]